MLRATLKVLGLDLLYTYARSVASNCHCSEEHIDTRNRFLRLDAAVLRVVVELAIQAMVGHSLNQSLDLLTTKLAMDARRQVFALEEYAAQACFCMPVAVPACCPCTMLPTLAWAS